MALFGRKPKKESAGGPSAQHPPAGQGPGPAYREALARCMGVARLRQQRFGGWLGDRGWNVDFSRGMISFGDSGFPLAFLGTQSELEGTFLWGADNVNGFSEELVGEVTALFRSEAVQALPEINQTCFEVGELVDGHGVASLFVGTLRERRYCSYRCPYEGGAAFVAVKELPEALFAPAGAPELFRITQELISTGALPHRPLVEGLLAEHAAEVEAGETELRARLADGHTALFAFDGLGRVASMNAQIGGQG